MGIKFRFVIAAVIIYYELRIAKGKNVFIITGSTGVLGRALVQAAFNHPDTSHIYMGFRSLSKLLECHHDIFTSDSYNSLLGDTPVIRPFYIDALATDIKSHFLMNWNLENNANLYVINNAGIFLSGITDKTVYDSIAVNVNLPVQFMLHMISYCQKKPLELKSCQQINIINISSGDGEVAYLNTDLSNDISAISNYNELISFYETLTADSSKLLKYGKIAFGDTPIYSLTKALLNKASLVFHNQFHPIVRVISVCPGNFESTMTTDDERNIQGSMQQVSDVATTLITTAVQSREFPSGYFYRNTEVINW